MADLVTRLSLETGQFDSGISSAISSVQKLDKQSRLASKGLGEFFSQANTSEMRAAFSGVDQVLKNLERSVSASGGSMKKDLRSMTLAAQELEKTWRQLSATEKSTSPGQELRNHIDQLIAQAGNLKDTMGDVQSVINFQASDTKNLDVLAQGLTTVSAGFQVASGAASLFGVSEEKIAKVQKDLVAIMAITNGLQTIQNALQKDSSLMTALRATKEKILAAAILAKNTATTIDNKLTATNTAGQVANTTVTVIATTAKKAWNVATAVSKALLGDFTGLILVGAVALGTYALASSNSTDEIKKQNKATEEATKFQNEYNSSVAQTTGQLISKYKQLQIQWESLKTTGEKTTWIKNNANEFANLGLKVTDLKSAEDVFVNNTNNMVAALEARARAMAAQNMLVKAYEKYYQDNMNADNTVSGGGYYRRAKVGDTVDREEGKRSGIYNSNRSGYSNFRIQNQEEADKVNQQREAEARKRNTEAKEENTKQLKKSTDYLTKEIKVGNERAKKLGINVDTGKTTTTKTGSGRSGSRSSINTTTDKIAARNSLKWYEEEISKLDNKIKLEPDPDNVKTLLQMKKDLEKQKEDFQIEVGLKEAPADKNSLAGINKQINDLQKELQLEPDLDSDKARQNVLKLKSLISKRDILSLKMTPKLYDENSIRDLQEQIKKIDDRLNNENLSLDSRLKLINTKSELENQITKITNGELSIPAKIKPDFIEKGSVEDKLQSYQNAKNQIEDINLQFDLGIIGFDDANKQIDEIISKLKELGITFDENQIKAGLFTEKLNNTKEVTSSVEQIGSAFSQLGSAIGGSAGETIGAMGQIASTIAQTIGQVIALMMANGVSSAMSLPFPANLAAVATVLAGLASIIASIKSAQSGSFAQGGIVPGTSYSGDKLIARVNSSEMILNTRQQKNLFNLLNGQSSIRGAGGSGQVEFKIKGSELYGVLRNFNDKKSKLV